MQQMIGTAMVCAAACLGACVAGPRRDAEVVVDTYAFETGFRCSHYLDLAIELQGLDEGVRIARLRELARPGPRASEVFVLCRLLFEARPGGEFPRPLIGAPEFVPRTQHADGAPAQERYPLEPIALFDGVPILIVRGYQLGGLPESPSGDLEKCAERCRWRSVPLKLRSREQIHAAIEGYLRDHAADEDERAFLLEQAG